ncbi:MAG: Eco57I restriction-modification methylase domain-containing protein [Patescibacteria group bacterium]
MPRIFTQEQLGKDRVNGFYETPLKTVEYICNKILPFYKKGMKILDPAVGDGVFLYALKQAGVSVHDLYGFDIDTQKVSSLKKIFPHVTVFDATNPFPETFDFIVGNPPYNGDESYFIRENRTRLKKQFKEIDAKNTYSMIAYRAIHALRQNGIFSMILSDSFLTNNYYRKFRLFLLRTTAINELLLAPWKLFHGRSADVRTCILTATKKEESDIIFQISDDALQVRLIDRVKSEQEYDQPRHLEYIRQQDFSSYPDSTFLIGVSPQIRKLYLTTPLRLGDIVGGGTGISTGNDKRFLKTRTEVAKNTDWVPYFKNGARRAYYYEPEFYIEKNYRDHAKTTDNYLVRNEKFFFREGISCSSVGVRFSASYLPPGCLFGVNANFFFRDRETLFYTLGLLNTKIAWYFARKVLIRTNNISANYLRKLPYKEPPAAEKKKIALMVEAIVNNLRTSSDFDFSAIQAKLDKKFYQIFRLTPATIKDIDEFCSNFYESL